MKNSTLATAALLLILCSCTPANKAPERITTQPFGKAGSSTVELYTLRNSKGFEVSITNYGGIVTSIKAPDNLGRIEDVVLGFDSLSGYLAEHPYFGALIGRYGNRIGKARFQLDGKEYVLAANNGPNSLHGGRKGFDKVVWQAQADGSSAEPSLTLNYTSQDGEEGFPGTLKATVKYTVTENNELKIDYTATSDKNTVVNLTNHTYFNLSGAGNGDILNHEIHLFASKFTPIDSDLIPTGKLADVRGTPFDFTTPVRIGARINDENEQIRHGLGYDHNFVLDSGGGTLAPAATVRDPKSGRFLEVSTTEPGVQFYTGNFLDGTLIGKAGKPYQKRYGFCLETQHFPDSPNQPAFPSVVLAAGGKYSSSTVYRFSVK